MFQKLDIKSIFFKLLRLPFKLLPSQLITLTVVLTLLLFLPQTWVTWQAYNDFNSIIKNELRLQSLSEKITYYDEVLTMSARMNAVTANSVWERRYRQFEPLLDAVIKESIQLAPEVYNNQDAKETDLANKRLVEMEYKSFDLVRKGQALAARSLLLSSQYESEKRKYASGVNKINQAIAILIDERVLKYKIYLLWSIGGSVTSLAFLIPSWLLVLRLLKNYLTTSKMAQITLRDLNYELEMRVEKRAKELRYKNDQLTQTLQKLQQTQLQLIQTEKMSSLGEMVAGIAHEINNPITFVKNNVSYVKEYSQDLLNLIRSYQDYYTQPPDIIQVQINEIDLEFIQGDFIKILNSIEYGTDRVEKIVKSLRNFSRLDEAEIKSVDIHEGIDSTLMILSHRLTAIDKHPEILLIKEYASLPLVECYPGLLNQVFMNILVNAIDALHEYNWQRTDDEIKNSPSRIQICTHQMNESWIQIRIIDNGIGIPENIRDKLFNPFFTTKPLGKGTGIGLSISYQIIVEKHTGKLYCNSTEEQGTEFVIEIPITQNSSTFTN
ncbi:Periplasmic Sensor Signal Transduction Histidine Kinase [Trichormus variabilis ATCC 29413]|uniref:histidine kinase n=3 Tax=Anabaena variabilis TaxID=264691 RepID=Q3MB40_TRIV2|nr:MULTISPECIES: ATP-binding protein [Nostocaceae]ABA21796.1 Periplasmic Sensor Signal Transduction Histidine Kinase [Trichormus variabilis ATCC 29413]MBD2383071.1 HAMP domain-containing histidine kinase [Trichormus variabilis FACHB-319]MBC1216907.1 HAMP domain-containing histidine kinase [Trichormus variabilis ARAD]MBC1269532.1 HAMP domain-containing histidine kinase [Trichormus variabilis FSR]MBC1304274.1 HAMP domain-containing histidine kinase [Trichormus variabilis N2B]